MRSLPVKFVLALLVLVGAARAEEIVLTTGAVLRGTVEEESATEVVLATESGRMRIGRSMIREIRRGTGTAPLPEEARKRAVIVGRVENVCKGVPAATTGKLVVLASAGGGVIGLDPATGETLWNQSLAGAVATGLSADPGGVYLVTEEGEVTRLDPRTGSVLWTAWAEGRVSGPPLRVRSTVFVFGPGRGLYSIEAASGKIRGLLSIDAVPDTPPAHDGTHVLVGTDLGVLCVMSGDGRRLLGTYETSGRWFGRPLPLALHSLVLGAKDALATFLPGEGKVSATLQSPGVTGHPLGAAMSVAYCDIGGVLTSVSLRTGRPGWSARGVGSVTGLAAHGGDLLVTTSDGTLAALAMSNGSVRWSIDLGAPGVGAPVAIDDRIVVVTEAGEAQFLRIETGGEAPDDMSGPQEEEALPFHAPEGFAVTIPSGWEIAPHAMRGDVALGLQPIAGAERFRRSGADEIARRRFFLRGQMLVRVVESRGESGSDLALDSFTRMQLEARRAGRRLGTPTIKEVDLGGRKWTEVRVASLLPAIGGSASFVTRAVVSRLDEGRAVWVELLTPETHADLAGGDFEAMVESLTVEPDGPGDIGPEVRAAAQALETLQSADELALIPLLSQALSHEISDGLPGRPGDSYRLAELGSRPRGAFREILVRVEGEKSDRLARIRMGREGSRWVVMDWRQLFE